MDGYPTNLSVVVTIPFTEGVDIAALHGLRRELAIPDNRDDTILTMHCSIVCLRL